MQNAVQVSGWDYLLVADDHYLFGIMKKRVILEKGLSENDVTLVESHPILNQITSI